MRPRSLHLQGFTAFRTMDEPVSFVDADLFALTGPTGSGKTSLLDAMCFALYGRVPRLDARAVEPIVALGAQEARILFEFSVGDDVYTAARVVRRTKTGATTPEARLELHVDDERVVVASGADEVNETVSDLLGLTFDHFTKTVLLPQGAFASFLHDTPAKRQDLLRTLLDLGVYEQMRELAQHRKSRAEGEAAAHQQEVERLAGVTEEAEQAAAASVEAIQKSLAAVREVQPHLERLAGETTEIGRRIEASQKLVGQLAGLEMPDGVKAMAQAIVEATAALEQAEVRYREASDRVVTAEKQAAAMPDVAELSALDEQWKIHRGLVERRERGVATTDEARTRLDDAVARLEKARTVESEARAVLADLETRHRAHVLAVDLAAGDECPVCLRVVEVVAERAPLPALDDARSTQESAAQEFEAATREEASARAHLGSCESTLAAIDADLAGIDRSTAGKPSPEQVRELLEQHRRHLAEIAGLREEERRRQQDVETARSALTRLREAEARGRRELSAVRDRLAEAEPPELELADLTADWNGLLGWAEGKRVELEAVVAGENDRLRELKAEVEKNRATVIDELDRHSLRGEPEKAVELLVAALADAELKLGQIRADRESAERAAQQLAVAAKHGEVAKLLARHLQASGFEGWLMEEALHGLVAGANVLLGQLSSGAYSLEMKKRDFMVIDHRNADETRGVKTLSGGETFLVSLALALSLAEQIGAMAAGGSARLESIFLDEGFGTLDVDTLDVVATVIQELGASGRTVGIVTHVTELAELVPTRYEVVRGAGGSSVRRIDT